MKALNFVRELTEKKWLWLDFQTITANICRNNENTKRKFLLASGSSMLNRAHIHFNARWIQVWNENGSFFSLLIMAEPSLYVNEIHFSTWKVKKFQNIVRKKWWGKNNRVTQKVLLEKSFFRSPQKASLWYNSSIHARLWRSLRSYTENITLTVHTRKVTKNQMVL